MHYLQCPLTTLKDALLRMLRIRLTAKKILKFCTSRLIKEQHEKNIRSSRSILDRPLGPKCKCAWHNMMIDDTYIQPQENKT